MDIWKQSCFGSNLVLLHYCITALLCVLASIRAISFDKLRKLDPINSIRDLHCYTTFNILFPAFALSCSFILCRAWNQRWINWHTTSIMRTDLYNKRSQGFFIVVCIIILAFMFPNRFIQSPLLDKRRMLHWEEVASTPCISHCYSTHQ